MMIKVAHFQLNLWKIARHGKKLQKLKKLWHFVGHGQNCKLAAKCKNSLKIAARKIAIFCKDYPMQNTGIGVVPPEQLSLQGDYCDGTNELDRIISLSVSDSVCLELAALDQTRYNLKVIFHPYAQKSTVIIHYIPSLRTEIYKHM